MHAAERRPQTSQRSPEERTGPALRNAREEDSSMLMSLTETVSEISWDDSGAPSCCAQDQPDRVRCSRTGNLIGFQPIAAAGS